MSKPIETVRTPMPWQKRVADLCTAARGPLALALVWLGIVRGKDGIQLAFILLLVAATLDTLDGFLARLSHYPHQTWVGSHDLAFDIAFSVALLVYLSLAGYLSPYLTAFYVGFWLLVFGSQNTLSNTLAVLFQAPIYAGVVIAAVLHDLNMILWIAIWVGLMLVFAGKRFFRVRLPGFFQDLSRKIPPAMKRVGWASGIQRTAPDSPEKRNETRIGD
ncbi:MAG: CDP-alcohol phosphatidyltransferase family protein [Chloroflexota bacterium]